MFFKFNKTDKKYFEEGKISPAAALNSVLSEPYGYMTQLC